MIKLGSEERLGTSLERRVFSYKRSTSGKIPEADEQQLPQSCILRTCINASVSSQHNRLHIAVHSSSKLVACLHHSLGVLLPPSTQCKANKQHVRATQIERFSRLLLEKNLADPSRLHKCHHRNRKMNHRPTTGLTEPDVSGFIVARSRRWRGWRAN